MEIVTTGGLLRGVGNEVGGVDILVLLCLDTFEPFIQLHLHFLNESTFSHPKSDI